MKHLLPITFSAALVTLAFGLTSCSPGGHNVDQRVSESMSRLSETEGGQRLADAIVAHGGLQKWFSNGDLQFRWTYNMKDRGPEAVVDSLQIIDTWSSKAVHTVPDTDISFGWTGESAWIKPADAEFMPPPDFWSLTPYYFVGVPFVLADPGTNHELLEETITFEDVAYDQVKVTYEDGTGETPDDYYIVLIHPETDQVKAVRYIVTHPKLYPDGPSPEKLITYEDLTEMDGIFFPAYHRSYEMTEDGQVGAEIRDAQVSELQYLPHSEERFAIPEGAKTY